MKLGEVDYWVTSTINRFHCIYVKKKIISARVIVQDTRLCKNISEKVMEIS